MCDELNTKVGNSHQAAALGQVWLPMRIKLHGSTGLKTGATVDNGRRVDGELSYWEP